MQPYMKAYIGVVKPRKVRSWEYINWIIEKHEDFKKTSELEEGQPYNDRLKTRVYRIYRRIKNELTRD